MTKKSTKENRLDAFAVSFAKTILKLRWLVILLTVAATGYLATGAQHLAFSNNYRVFFSPENPELVNFEEFQETYSKSDNFFFVIKPKDGSDVFTNETLAVVAELTEATWQLPYTRRVDSLTNFQYTYAIEDDLIVEDLIVDPGNSSPEELAQRREAALAEPLVRDQLLTRDGKVTAINVVLNFPELALTEVPEAVAEARALRDRIVAENPDIELYLTGTSMLNNAFSEAIISDFSTLIPAMIVIILLMTVLCVRSFSAMLVTQVIVILSCAGAMGWAGFVGIELAGPSPSATIIILTLAIADSIHILISVRAAMRAGMNKRDAIVEGIRINFLAVSITSLTTIIGFMALNFSDSPPFRDMGNISAAGIFIAWMLSLTLLPALLSLIPLRVKVQKDANDNTLLGKFADFVIGHYRVIFFTSAIATVALIAMIPRIELSDNFRKYFDERIEFRSETDKVVDYFGFYPIEFQFKSGTPGGVNEPELLKKLDEFSEWLREQPNVTHVYSVADIMKRLNKNMNGDDPAFYRIPDDRELAAQYLLLFELSLPYGLDLTDRIDLDKSATRVTVTASGDQTSKASRQLLRDVEDWFARNAPEYQAPGTGPQVMFTFIAQRNVESMVQGTILAVIAIAIIMMLALRSASMGLLSMLPNGLPILAAFGAWALLVGEVGFSVAAVASLSLGIVIDDTVHFLTKYTRARKEKGLTTADSIRYAFETVGQAIMVNTAILMAGFLVVTFSAFKINMEMGLLTSLSIGFALLLDFLFLPALLLMLARRAGEPISARQGETNVAVS
jgi:hypothetical protein